jgi:molecular chaperone GrpE
VSDKKENDAVTTEEAPVDAGPDGEDETREQQPDEPAAGDEPGAESEVERLKGELAELNDRMLRMAADFENRGKRMEREKQQAIEYAEEGLLKEILPFIDNLERALAQDASAENAAENIMEGVRMTLDGLLAALARRGLEPIDSVGGKFDPNVHEAMSMQPAGDGVEPQTVIEEFEKGYRFKNRLLRAAKVVVAAG